MIVEERIAAEAASAVSTGILPQLMLVYLNENPIENPISITTQAGSVRSISYMIGYSKAVHRFYEAETGVHINDGTMILAAIGSVFQSNTMDECLDAMNQAFAALDADAPGAREAFVMGMTDYDAVRGGVAHAHSGLVELLGIGGAQ